MAAAHVGKPLDRRRGAQVFSGRVSNRRFDLTAHRTQIQLVEVELELFANIGIIGARAERSLQSRKESMPPLRRSEGSSQRLPRPKAIAFRRLPACSVLWASTRKSGAAAGFGNPP